MELTEFTKGASGSGLKCFLGKRINYLYRVTFLEACWSEFYLNDEFDKPSHEVIYNAFVRALDNYGEDDSPMEMENRYCFCDKNEKGAFKVFVLDEKDLK
ncbi:hypothetical protein [Peribacillus frigoritolerans]|uniref:hypothetical protein n=1 Tax=Peribacillus frigoritolerans TaxID=450367 RepID=UPI0039A06E93